MTRSVEIILLGRKKNKHILIKTTIIEDIKMGRPKKQIDDAKLLQMRGEEKHLKDISKEMGVSVPTLSRRIADLHYKQGVLTKYRELQGLQLTEYQAKFMEAITPEKIENASLTELVKCFEIFKKIELAIEPNQFKVHGLMQYLLLLEKEDEENKLIIGTENHEVDIT